MIPMPLARAFPTGHHEIETAYLTLRARTVRMSFEDHATTATNNHYENGKRQSSKSRT